MEVLRRIRETDAFANLVLPAEIQRQGLDARDASFATELTYGTLRMRGTLDWIVSLYSSRSLDRVDPEVLDALRLGTYQLVYARVPPHAAVSETVGTLSRPGAGGFVNAVLREVASGASSIPWPQRQGDPVSYLQITYGHPRWIVELWIDELGEQDAEALCAAGNEYPGTSVRSNVAATTPRALADAFREAGLDVRPGRYSPQAFTVVSGGQPSGWPGYAQGHFAVQDEASVLAASALGLEPGMRVADACAGPGGKTGHLAESGAAVLAMELHPQRARMVSETMERLRLPRHLVVTADATMPPVRPRSLDAVLLDAPCSGLGVLRRRPEARWRVRPADIERSAVLQSRLIDEAFALVRPGGQLVYSVCTLTRAETVDVVDAFARSNHEAQMTEVHPHIPRRRGDAGPWLTLYPYMHHTDGMFICSIRRVP